MEHATGRLNTSLRSIQNRPVDIDGRRITIRSGSTVTSGNSPNSWAVSSRSVEPQHGPSSGLAAFQSVGGTTAQNGGGPVVLQPQRRARYPGRRERVARRRKMISPLDSSSNDRNQVPISSGGSFPGSHGFTGSVPIHPAWHWSPGWTSVSDPEKGTPARRELGCLGQLQRRPDGAGLRQVGRIEPADGD